MTQTSYKDGKHDETQEEVMAVAVAHEMDPSKVMEHEPEYKLDFTGADGKATAAPIPADHARFFCNKCHTVRTNVWVGV
jgi:hypothetical protein